MPNITKLQLSEELYNILYDDSAILNRLDNIENSISNINTNINTTNSDLSSVKNNIQYFYEIYKYPGQTSGTGEVIEIVVNPGETKSIMSTPSINFSAGLYLFFISVTLRITATTGYSCDGYCYIKNMPSDINTARWFNCHNDNINLAEDNQALNVSGVQPIILSTPLYGPVHVVLTSSVSCDAVIHVPAYQWVYLRIIRLK